MEVGLGEPAPPKRAQQHRQFSAHVYSGWIKTKLGVESGLGPGDIVSDGDKAPSPPKEHIPQF